MLDTIKDSISLHDYKIAVNKKISKNLIYLMKEHGYNQNSLREALQAQGIEINQGTINKYLRHADTNFIPVAVLIKCSELFRVSLEKLILEDFSTALYNKSEYVKAFVHEPSGLSKLSFTEQFRHANNDFIVDSNDRAFSGLYGDYHCYLFPTLSSDSRPLIGTFTMNDQNQLCEAYLRIPNQQKLSNTGCDVYKEYKGIVIISNSLHNCYCILRSSPLGEFCFIIFRHIYLTNRPLDCRLSEVLTVSAGESHCPTVHRMFFSRQALSDEDLSLLLPHLHLSGSDIIIAEKDLLQMQELSLIPNPALSQLIQSSNPIPFYSFKEDYVFRLLEHYLPESGQTDILIYLSLIRERAVSQQFNRINRHADRNVRNLLLALGYYSSN